MIQERGKKLNDIKISIIIPVYNVEKYLNECIDSVISQSYKNLEIILVDDGSLDKSGIICDDYISRDSRIKVVHKENGGLSSARNVGIGIATGEYITFLDSDDYWDDPCALEKIMNKVELGENTVISWGVKKLYESTGKIDDVGMYVKTERKLAESKEESFKRLVESECYIASACNKLIKRDLIIRNNIYFIEDMKSEDIDWCARIAIKAQKFEFNNNSFYIYRQRDGSISKSLEEKNIVNLLEAIKICYILSKEIEDDTFRKLYLSYVATQIVNTMICLNRVPRDLRKKYIKKLKKYKKVLKYGISKKTIIAYIFVSILGIRITTKLLGIVKKIKNYLGSKL